MVTVVVSLVNMLMGKRHTPYLGLLNHGFGVWAKVSFVSIEGVNKKVSASIF